MTTGIYLSAMTQDSGKSLIALGLADSLVKRADRVGFFRPIFKGETASDDPMIRLMKEHFNLSDEQVGGAVSLTEAQSSLRRATPKKFRPARFPPMKKLPPTAML